MVPVPKRFGFLRFLEVQVPGFLQELSATDAEPRNQNPTNQNLGNPRNQNPKELEPQEP